MRLLGVDTATGSLSVGLVENGCVLAEITLKTGRTHATHIMEVIHHVIALPGLRAKDIDGFAVVKGPGSFTGLRIGISTVKGLALASGKPVVGISSLEALAVQCAFFPHLVCPILDARKGEVYSGVFRCCGNGLKRERVEMVGPIEKAIADIPAPCLFIGDGAVKHRRAIVEALGGGARFVPPASNAIRASTVLHLGMKRFENQDTDDVAALTPDYIRRSDAELGLGKKRNPEKR